MQNITQKAITPITVMRFAVLVALGNYYLITSAPSARSITTYWYEVMPIVGKFSESLLPLMFLFNMVVVIGFYRERPFTTLSLSLLPIFIYTSLSAGWWLGTYPDLNFAAIGTHSVVVLLFLSMLWREQHESSISTS